MKIFHQRYIYNYSHKMASDTIINHRDTIEYTSTFFHPFKAKKGLF